MKGKIKNIKICNLTISLTIIFSLAFFALATAQEKELTLFPCNGATDVNIDTHLRLTFNSTPVIGSRGFIKVYDAHSGKLIDKLDMSIPPGPERSQPNNPAAQYTPVPYEYSKEDINNKNTKPGKPSGVNKPDNSRYQLTIIGGFSDAFHFYPIIVHGNTATIYLHNNMLEYGHEYYVTIDNGVIEGFNGIKGKNKWRFTTKRNAPDKEKRMLTVAADGSADFSTLQGAMDYIPSFAENENERWTVNVKNGDYEEIVYFRNKNYVSIIGESMEGVCIHYPNNEVFNPHPYDIKTNELKGTFPSRRAAVAADNCHHLIIKDITFKTDCKGQAEGFLINGSHNYGENIHIIGSGDALQANGSAYWLNCIIDGEGDTVLGRGPSFFNNCTINSYGPFMWIRNTDENHGNIFVNCRLNGLGDRAVIARLPNNKGRNYPHAECVLLNCTLNNIRPEGFGPIGEEAKTARLWEFNSHNAEGKVIDTSRRHPQVRQLDAIKDAETIAKYNDYRFVLDW